ncbi:putative phage abortive infection protein [Pseudomonas sp. LT1P18]|uniref:putative phage abortive infection protein n=1 Tax=Pseudomonas arabinosi TaxID=3398357 RepID=UPI0039F09F8D
MNKIERSQQRRNIWKIALVLFFVLDIYIVFFAFLLWDTPLSEVAGKIREGEFGDSFGTLNVLFSGFAFSGVIITMLLQRKDLEETQGQAAKQQIESHFYSMLELQQNLVQSFDLKRNGVVIMVGRDCFKSWLRFFRAEYGRGKNSHEAQVVRAYRELWSRYQGDLSVYFRSLYSVFRFVSESNHADKKKLGVVVRSLLSDFELVILFYNCVNPRGIKFQEYAYEFAIFDNLDHRMLLNPRDVKLLSKAAYGGNEEILALFDDEFI